jgi:beta-glucosidase
MHYQKLTSLCFLFTILTTNVMAQKAPQLRADNIDEVIKSMTLEEKAMLLVGGQNPGNQGSGATFGHTMNLVAGAAGTTTPIPRLGIPSVSLADGPAGLRIDPIRKDDSKTYYCTGFPVGTALASTWNPQLVEQVGKAIGNEVHEYGVDVILGPGMNLHRNPLCGRNFEYYSEDPLLSGKIAAAYIRGVQSEGVGTSAKHFAVNSQESDRTRVDERVSQRALRELYLKGFEIMVKEGKPWTVMSSYNKINGTFTQESHDLLTDILRNEWGFKGLVMTDWTGLRNTAAQVHAGNDLMEPGMGSQVTDIIDKVKSGKLAERDVDVCVRRVLELVVRSPRFSGYKYSDAPDLKAHAEVTRQSAAEGMVLLKNYRNTLPVKNIKKVALFGVNSYDFLSGGTGSGCVHTPYVVDMVKGLANAGISTTKTLTDIYQKYIDYAKVKFQADKDPYMWFLSFGQAKLPEMEVSQRCADSEVNDADAAIITIGRQAGEGLDRTIDNEFNLTDLEHALINRVSGVFRNAGKPVIVVINSGSVIETASWQQLADAILVAWQPGEEGGNSVADVLTGKVNPSGHLTMTWPVMAMDHPSSSNFPLGMTLYDYKEMSGWGVPIKFVDFTNHDEDIYVGYRYFDTFGKDVSYPFGFGLSYTTFAYGKPSVSASNDKITVSVSVKNTGSCAGKEVAQVYVSAPKGKLEKPEKELKAFAKTKQLKPGESETLKMIIDRRDLASFDDSQSKWIGDAGTYTFKVGDNVEDIKGSCTLSLKAYEEKVTNVLAPQQPLTLLKQNKK